ncbi:NAD-dependent epimerase/dehydratase family protein [Actinoplanes couchii]|uniref:NAD-dependent epimerase n=1 Tax=Actinoplanes couchii TaxID=403638 RepID=A0ABQ3XPT7_9ACTN|nr:NAD(P)-dependent oxidoreductase [Actinoplanes couchii]MDR6319158.1 nucleoside-diphosphate-sugar epimerase [Actinoplanes couchii]GID60498.1 NAD-dependent epimerase [Actinoplanes couchii]
MDDPVTVTGTSGLVGAAVAAALDGAGWTVRGVDRVPGRWTDVVGDLRDPAVRDQVSGVVVHAAALHAPHVGRVADREFRRVNVEATAALLPAASRFVFISSTSVYGHALVPADRAVWVDELLTPRPRDVYDETKLAAEQLVADSGTDAITLRIARCFPEPPQVLATHLLHRAVRLPDVADAVVRAIRLPDVTGVFNIAGRYPFTRDDCPALHRDAAALITERLPDVARHFRERGWPLPGTIDRVYDSSAAEEALGYRPSTGWKSSGAAA